jgi:hypothetical protein
MDAEHGPAPPGTTGGRGSSLMVIDSGTGSFGGQFSAACTGWPEQTIGKAKMTQAAKRSAVGLLAFITTPSAQVLWNERILDLQTGRQRKPQMGWATWAADMLIDLRNSLDNDAHFPEVGNARKLRI